MAFVALSSLEKWKNLKKVENGAHKMVQSAMLITKQHDNRNKKMHHYNLGLKKNKKCVPNLEQKNVLNLAHFLKCFLKYYIF